MLFVVLLDFADHFERVPELVVNLRWGMPGIQECDNSPLLEGGKHVGHVDGQQSCSGTPRKNYRQSGKLAQNGCRWQTEETARNLREARERGLGCCALSWKLLWDTASRLRRHSGHTGKTISGRRGRAPKWKPESGRGQKDDCSTGTQPVEDGGVVTENKDSCRGHKQAPDFFYMRKFALKFPGRQKLTPPSERVPTEPSRTNSFAATARGALEND